jgi:hypothetical protein
MCIEEINLKILHKGKSNGKNTYTHLLTPPFKIFVYLIWGNLVMNKTLIPCMHVIVRGQ